MPPRKGKRSRPAATGDVESPSGRPGPLRIHAPLWQCRVKERVDSQSKSLLDCCSNSRACKHSSLSETVASPLVGVNAHEALCYEIILEKVDFLRTLIQTP